jgi:hypothetical protein
MIVKKVLFSLLVALSAASVRSAETEPDRVVWVTPSQDSLDSMPLSGRMGAGANVWVQDGSIWLYLAHNGAYDEQGRLLKLGCLRITPVDVALGGDSFRQELDLSTGSIAISQGTFKADLWFAGETLIIETSTGKPVAMDVAFGTWRDQPRQGLQLDVWGSESMNPDRVTADEQGFLWLHRNADYPVDVVAKARGQGIEETAVLDATTQRVSGGAVAVAGGLGGLTNAAVRWQHWDGRAWTGRTRAGTHQAIAVALGAAIDAKPEAWRTRAEEMLKQESRDAARADELKRWAEFWSRSHVRIADCRMPNAELKKEEGGTVPVSDIRHSAVDTRPSDAVLIGQNYQLFRYMLACNRDGELPLLFNGGIFTTDAKPGRITGNNNDELRINPDGATTPDFRRWMGCRFMSQNQRWLGWPTIANGDADLLWPSLRFYRDRAATAASRARKNGAEGVVYPEPLDIWGLCCVGPRPDGLCGAEHLVYHFSMMLEHAWMALQARDALDISLERDLPWIEGTIRFYDSFYRAQTKQRTGKELGDDGRLVLYPTCGLEFAGGATDAIEVVSGLKRITAGLLALPDLPAPSRERLRRILPTLPELPAGHRQGRRSLLPAKTWERDYNKWEPIEMYAAWPYRLVGITQPDTLQLARDTWETVPADRARLCKQDFSWMANVANMAALAWPEKAKERAIYKLANNTAPQARFPAFFGPGHDWLPDHNWGGSGMTGLQEMLLAPEPGPDGKLHLFAGWPAEWDVDFKLHAPGPTIVEAVLRGGKLEKLKVSPESRSKDIVNWLGKWPDYARPAPPLSQGKAVTVSSQFDQPGYDAARAVDGDLGTRWASDFQARSGWLAVDLGEEKEIGRVWISEIEWPETEEFVLQVRQGESWAEVARGTTIGSDKSIEFPPVRTRAVRLNVIKAKRPININEFQVFAAEG